MVDTDGRGLKLQAHSAGIQDRDGAAPLLVASRPWWPFVQLGYADAGYQGPRVQETCPIRIEILRKPEGQVGFAVHARRWVVERFFAWINRNRRLAKDFEASIASAEAFLYAASAMLLLRRLARCQPIRNGLSGFQSAGSTVRPSRFHHSQKLCGPLAPHIQSGGRPFRVGAPHSSQTSPFVRPAGGEVEGS